MRGKDQTMRTSTMSMGALSLILCVAVCVPAEAQNRNIRGAGGRGGGVQIGVGGGNGQQNTQAMQQAIQQIDQQLQQGQTVLKEASERAAEVRGEYQKVDMEHKQNLRELAQAKKLAEEAAKNSPELKAARNKVDALRSDLADVRKKVIEKLTAESEEYQEAVKAYEAAVAEQKANSGPNVSQDARRELVKKVAEADRRKKTIEDGALSENTDAKTLNQQIKDALAEVAAAVKANNEAIESDPTINSAKVAFQRSRDDLKKAKADLAQAEGEMNRIRAAMLQLTNQRAALDAQIQFQQRQQQNGVGNQQGGNRYSRPR